METAILSAENDLLFAAERAAELLARGEAVALPTETVYGLAADALRAEAVLKIFEAKERPFFDPLIVHLPDIDWLERIANAQRPLVKQLVETFWPGPLTLVLPRREKIVPDLATAGLQTVAVRMSAHPVFREVITRFGKPLAAPSANRFGRISPTNAQHVFSELGGRIPLIIDGGVTSHGVESTIVSFDESDENAITILRSGPVTAEQLAQFGAVHFSKPDDEKNPLAPGQLKSHYAPRTPMKFLSEISDLKTELASRRCGLLAWRKPSNEAGFAAIELLSENENLRESAANLFAAMRRLDEANLDLILAEPVPEIGLGVAIMDRLRKAAAR